MKRFKLRELLNTKYLYITFSVDLNYILNTYLELKRNPEYPYNSGSAKLDEFYEVCKSGEEIEIDLAEIRITSDVTPSINRYASLGVRFIDTENPGRNSILEENRKRLDTVVETVPLPKYDGTISAKSWVAELKEDVVYKVPPILSTGCMMQLIILTQIARPSIQFEMNDCIYDVMRKVASYFTTSDYSRYNKFYIVTPEGIFVWERGTDLYIQRRGFCDLEEAANHANIIPYVFGTEKTLKDEILGALFKDCLMEVNEYRTSLPTPLSSYI